MLLFSCNSISEENSQYKMNCESVRNGFYRCENKEVVCYNLYQEVLQCKFKESK